jgi:hypothetical protein
MAQAGGGQPPQAVDSLDAVNQAAGNRDGGGGNEAALGGRGAGGGDATVVTPAAGGKKKKERKNESGGGGGLTTKKTKPSGNVGAPAAKRGKAELDPRVASGLVRFLMPCF